MASPQAKGHLVLALQLIGGVVLAMATLHVVIAIGLLAMLPAFWQACLFGRRPRDH